MDHIQNSLFLLILVVCGCQNGCNNDCEDYEVGTVAASLHFWPTLANPEYNCSVPPGTNQFNDWCDRNGDNIIPYLIDFKSVNKTRYVLYAKYSFSCEDFVNDEVWAPYISAGTAHVGDCYGCDAFDHQAVIALNTTGGGECYPEFPFPIIDGQHIPLELIFWEACVTGCNDPELCAQNVTYRTKWIAETSTSSFKHLLEPNQVATVTCIFRHLETICSVNDPRMCGE